MLTHLNFAHSYRLVEDEGEGIVVRKTPCQEKKKYVQEEFRRQLGIRVDYVEVVITANP